MMEHSPLIFDIRHFVLDDGPGIRTTVFLKGCLLFCGWCHNPEGMNKNKEIVFNPDLCIFCADCESVCPNQAIDLKRENRIIPEKCDCCGLCTLKCPSKAMRMIGKYYSPDELVDILLSDQLFYQTSKGGVTFSGGEPTLFMDYLSIVCGKLKKNNVHIAIQTSGYFDMSIFQEKLLPLIDMVFFDLKLMDKDAYRRWIGGDVNYPLENFKQLCKHPGIHLIASIPLIPGITSTKENLSAIKEFLDNSGCHEWIFRPYHPGGKAKSVFLGKEVSPSISEKHISLQEERRAKRIFFNDKTFAFHHK
jgi:pyruvate formate lyase activating enzyme